MDLSTERVYKGDQTDMDFIDDLTRHNLYKLCFRAWSILSERVKLEQLIIELESE